MFSWLLITQFSYGIVLTILYTLTVLILIMNWKHFDKYFSQLYVYQFFFNIWMYSNFYISNRIPSNTCADCTLSSWFSSMAENSLSRFPVYIFLFLQYHLAYINYSNVLLMSFNRLTMIFMNQSYVKIWETGTYLMIALILVFPIVFTLQLLTNDAYFEYNEPSEAYVVRTYADLSEVYSRILVWMIISTSLNLAMNVACWYKISRYSQTSSSRQKSDYRLFLFSFVTFLIQCIAFGLGIVNKISADVDPTKELLSSQIGHVLSPFGNDLLTLSAPIVLIVFSKRVRETFILIFKKRSLTLSSVTPVQNVQVVTMKTSDP